MIEYRVEYDNDDNQGIVVKFPANRQTALQEARRISKATSCLVYVVRAASIDGTKFVDTGHKVYSNGVCCDTDGLFE